MISISLGWIARSAFRAGRPRSAGRPALVAAVLVAAVVAVLALVAPAPARAEEPPGVKRVTTLMEMRRQDVVVQEWDLSCGAAALATLLQFQHGLPITERDIAAAMLTGTDARLVKARMGFSLLDMKRLVNAVGLEGTGYGGMDLPNLKGMAPAIVPIRVNSAFSHFVVVRGVVGDRVLLADPAFGNRTMPIHRFETVWEPRVAFIVQRRDGSPAPDRLAVRQAGFSLPGGAMLRQAVN